ncbi:MAG TPA: hypothetical protein VHX52_14830 [Steroidobacteraceae bacterium]|jgi:hypothetical protein|nr:hypothetical protein [Steroidobacteraceae bacterium]
MKPSRQRRPLALIAIALLATAADWVGSVSAASGFDPRAITFVNLFRDTCMNHFARPQALRADLDEQGFQAVPAANASFFLGGIAGRTWVIARAGGRFVVASRDDGVCTVFARQATEADVQLFFKALVKSTASPALPTMQNPDKILKTPSGFVNYISYALYLIQGGESADQSRSGGQRQ